MKHTLCFPIILFIVVLISCTPEEVDTNTTCKNSEIPEIPVESSFDVNSDEIIDFTTVYLMYAIDGYNVTGVGIAGCISPSVSNLILSPLNEEDVLKLNDTIYADTSKSSNWTTLPRELISISSINGCWNDEWTESNMVNQNYCYVGIKVYEGDTEMVGYLKLQVDSTNGEITLADKVVTDQEYIVVQ